MIETIIMHVLPQGPNKLSHISLVSEIILKCKRMRAKVGG